VDKSLIEFTKIIRGRRHRNGCSSGAGQSRKSKPCYTHDPGSPHHRSATSPRSSTRNPVRPSSSRSSDSTSPRSIRLRSDQPFATHPIDAYPPYIGVSPTGRTTSGSRVGILDPLRQKATHEQAPGLSPAFTLPRPRFVAVGGADRRSRSLAHGQAVRRCQQGRRSARAHGRSATNSHRRPFPA